MQFKNPDLLYALLLLVIPIIVHLFQLRKFKEQAFTNVKFLKRVKLQTRKSSKLKKWLILFTRLCALAAIIIAFAQPFIPQSSVATQKKETVIYLDNSFSMQQQTQQGELLKNSVQELLQNIPPDQEFTLFTNNTTFRKTNLNAIKNELLQLDYANNSFTFSEAYLKAQQEFSKNESSVKNFLVLSDFQQKNMIDFPEISPTYKVNFIPLRTENKINFSIDSVYIQNKNLDNINLSVVLSANSATNKTLPVSLYNQNNKQLIAKSSVAFEDEKKAELQFTIPANKSLRGKVSIEDESLFYDNSFYFTIAKPEKISVAAISNENDNYINRIFSNEEEFQLEVFKNDEINYNKIENADFIILNELETIPNGLENILKKHLEKGGVLSIIPSTEINNSNYNNLLKLLNAGQFSAGLQENLKITKINFSHPLYSNVFNAEVDNFEYPSVEKNYNFQHTGNNILSYNNGSAFLAEKNNTYIFSAAINKENSNFKNSPLIAPTFYNMAKQSLQLPKLYFSMEKTNTFDVPVNLANDRVLKIENAEESFIPRQQKFTNKVQITTNELPEKAGQFSVINENDTLQKLSFNFNRNESDLNFSQLDSFKNITVSNDIASYFSEQRSKNEIDQLWKWFVIFALLFLAIEMLLLKFLK
ncbi:BatA domain-containing protein [Mesonia maritima]|uniref:Aerotolerance regulator N-terminal domain-containing protein n=1 Tax=Mesonia maritima TaxID=1793873 RepID=A0ABU1K6V7_9FLAO|nr:BatA domain-containing protein [Mesonia maritima]MDR6301041.1 hypothetical protein [Mesonia maritima]